MKYKVKRKKKSSPANELKQSVKKINWKLHISIVISTLAIFGIYQLCIYLHFKYIIHIYALVLAACGLSFGIINRGFSSKKLTAEDLPKEWSDDKKTQYIEEQNKRRKKAKLFLIPAFGILITFAFDIIYLFYLEPLIG